MELLIKNAEDYSVKREEDYKITICNNLDKEAVSFHKTDIHHLIKTLKLILTDFPAKVSQGFPEITFTFTGEIRIPKENEFYLCPGLYNEIQKCFNPNETEERAIYTQD